MRIAWARARCFVHATEDEERVRDAVLWTLDHAGDARAADVVERQRTRGHYGNEILVLEAALTRERDVAGAVARLLAAPDVRAALADTVGRRLDEDHVLHVRVDKQAAVGRELALTEGSDAIVVRLKGITQPGENALTAWSRLLREGTP